MMIISMHARSDMFFLLIFSGWKENVKALCSDASHTRSGVASSCLIYTITADICGFNSYLSFSLDNKHLIWWHGHFLQVNSAKEIEKNLKALKAKLSDEEVLEKSLDVKLIERKGKRTFLLRLCWVYVFNHIWAKIFVVFF